VDNSINYEVEATGSVMMNKVTNHDTSGIGQIASKPGIFSEPQTHQQLKHSNSQIIFPKNANQLEDSSLQLKRQNKALKKSDYGQVSKQTEERQSDGNSNLIEKKYLTQKEDREFFCRSPGSGQGSGARSEDGHEMSR
jgi:hypothetical protein